MTKYNEIINAVNDFIKIVVSLNKTKNDLMIFLNEAVPIFIYRYLISCNSLRQCGNISDAFGTVAKNKGLMFIFIPNPIILLMLYEPQMVYLK